MRGVVADDRDTAIKLAYLAESKRADAASCASMGGGIQEARPEFLLVYETVEIVQDETGLRFAIVAKDDASEARIALAQSELANKVALGEADAWERAAAQLGPIVTLDESWPGAASEG